MESIRISLKVDKAQWQALQELATETHENVSDLLAEAIRHYVRSRRLRPAVLRHLEDSIAENEELGHRLAE